MMPPTGPNPTGQPVQQTSTHAYSSAPSPAPGSPNPLKSVSSRAFQDADAARAEASTHATSTMGKLKQKLSAAGKPVEERRERIHQEAITRLYSEIEKTPSLGPGTKEALHEYLNYLNTHSFDGLSTDELEFLQLHDLLLPCIQYYRKEYIRLDEESKRTALPVEKSFERERTVRFEEPPDLYSIALAGTRILDLYYNLTELYAKEFDVVNKHFDEVNRKIDAFNQELDEIEARQPAETEEALEKALNIETSHQTIDELKLHKQTLFQESIVKYENALRKLDSSFKDTKTLPDSIQIFRDSLLREIEKLRTLQSQDLEEPILIHRSFTPAQQKHLQEIQIMLTACTQDLRKKESDYAVEVSRSQEEVDTVNSFRKSIKDLRNQRDELLKEVILRYDTALVQIGPPEENESPENENLRNEFIQERNKLCQGLSFVAQAEIFTEHAEFKFIEANLIGSKNELSQLEAELQKIKSRTTIKTGPLGIIDSPEVIRSDDDTERWNALKELIPQAKAQKDSLIKDLVLQYDQALAHIKAASSKLGVKKVPQEIVDLRKRLEGERDKLLGELTRPPLRIQLRKIWINLFGKKTEASP